MPPPQACGVASGLKTVVLQEPVNQPVASAQAAQVLASLAALPALEVLHFDARCLKWDQGVVATLQALQRARPQLQPLAQRPPAEPWADVQAVFEFDNTN